MPDTTTDTNPCDAPEGTVLLPTICRNDIDPIADPHEPPIGFGDGSLYMSWNLQLAESTQGAATDPRPYKYVLADQTRQRGHVAVVRILTEKNNGRAGFARYILPISTEARVLIWLQQLQWGSPGYPAVYENQSSDAHILVRGNNLVIETDRRMQASLATYKNSRRYGYEHPGYDRHFRIAAWKIVDSHNQVVTDSNGREFKSDPNDEGHYIYISFHD
jgi:hypothetical protein